MAHSQFRSRSRHQTSRSKSNSTRTYKSSTPNRIPHYKSGHYKRRNYMNNSRSQHSSKVYQRSSHRQFEHRRSQVTYSNDETFSNSSHLSPQFHHHQDHLPKFCEQSRGRGFPITTAGSLLQKPPQSCNIQFLSYNRPCPDETMVDMQLRGRVYSDTTARSLLQKPPQSCNNRLSSDFMRLSDDRDLYHPSTDQKMVDMQSRGRGNYTTVRSLLQKPPQSCNNRLSSDFTILSDDRDLYHPSTDQKMVDMQLRGRGNYTTVRSLLQKPPQSCNSRRSSDFTSLSDDRNLYHPLPLNDQSMPVSSRGLEYSSSSSPSLHIIGDGAFGEEPSINTNDLSFEDIIDSLPNMQDSNLTPSLKQGFIKISDVSGMNGK